MWDRPGCIRSSRNGSFNEVVKQAAPASSVGASGDTAGMISWDTGYIYVCTAAYDGSTTSGSAWR